MWGQIASAKTTYVKIGPREKNNSRQGFFSNFNSNKWCKIENDKIRKKYAVDSAVQFPSKSN